MKDQRGREARYRIVERGGGTKKRKKLQKSYRGAAEYGETRAVGEKIEDKRVLVQ